MKEKQSGNTSIVYQAFVFYRLNVTEQKGKIKCNHLIQMFLDITKLY